MPIKELPKGVYKSKVGSLNRDIEKSVSEGAQGVQGATSKAIKYAKKRELLLNSRWKSLRKSA